MAYVTEHTGLLTVRTQNARRASTEGVNASDRLMARRSAMTAGPRRTSIGLLVGVLAAACAAPATAPSASPALAQPPGSALPSPFGSPNAGSDAPASTPTASPSPSVVEGIGPDTLAVVVATDGLRVRSLPTVGEQSERLEPTLAEGVRVYITDGPAPADGYAWYQVQPYDGQRALPFGWIAAGSRDGEPWIEPLPLGCDSVAPSAEGLVTGERLEHLYCSTNARNPDITFEGNVWCTFADDHHGGLSGPNWIDQSGYCELRTASGSRWLYGAPVMRLLDEARNPVEGRYTITGHFDDPGAADCRASGMEGSRPPPPAAVILSCRTAFVVTEATPAS
jgi:hypothetical protein